MLSIQHIHHTLVEQTTAYVARQILLFLRESIDQNSFSVAAETTHKKRNPYPITRLIFHMKT